MDEKSGESEEEEVIGEGIGESEKKKMTLASRLRAATTPGN